MAVSERTRGAGMKDAEKSRNPNTVYLLSDNLEANVTKLNKLEWESVKRLSRDTAIVVFDQE
jgi:hypothetical protein